MVTTKHDQRAQRAHKDKIRQRLKKKNAFPSRIEISFSGNNVKRNTDLVSNWLKSDGVSAQSTMWYANGSVSLEKPSPATVISCREAFENNNGIQVKEIKSKPNRGVNLN